MENHEKCLVRKPVSGPKFEVGHVNHSQHVFSGTYIGLRHTYKKKVKWFTHTVSVIASQIFQSEISIY